MAEVKRSSRDSFRSENIRNQGGGAAVFVEMGVSCLQS